MSVSERKRITQVSGEIEEINRKIEELMARRMEKESDLAVLLTGIQVGGRMVSAEGKVAMVENMGMWTKNEPIVMAVRVKPDGKHGARIRIYPYMLKSGRWKKE